MRGPWLPATTPQPWPLDLPPPGLLADGDRLLVQRVLDDRLLAHRVGGLRHRSREPVFRFLLDHPDFAATIVRALRLRNYRLTPEVGAYRGDDGRGATGLVRVLYADDRRRLYHVEGRYVDRLLPPVSGRLLVLFEFEHRQDDHGGTLVDLSLTGYVALDTPLVGVLAETVVALSRSVVERAIERKVQRFFGTVSRLSRWAYDQPEVLSAALDGHPDVSQDEVLGAFRQILLADRLPAWAGARFRFLSTKEDED